MRFNIHNNKKNFTKRFPGLFFLIYTPFPLEPPPPKKKKSNTHFFPSARRPKLVHRKKVHWISYFKLKSLYSLLSFLPFSILQLFFNLSITIRSTAGIKELLFLVWLVMIACRTFRGGIPTKSFKAVVHHYFRLSPKIGSENGRKMRCNITRLLWILFYDLELSCAKCRCIDKSISVLSQSMINTSL